MRRPLFALPLLAAALAACDGDGVVQCAPSLPEAQFAVRVLVIDSVSGTSLAAGATGAFVTGNLADSLRHRGDELVADGPAGRYAVVVQRPGYVLWAADDVRVRAGDCGTESVQLTARLRRGGLD